MDSANLLRQQQLDFYSRLEKNKLSLNEQNYYFKELVMVGQNTIEEITLESIQMAEDIIRQYEFNYPRKQILNTIFYRQLLENGFLSHYGYLLSLETSNPENINFCSQGVTQHNFLLKKNNNIKVLLKAYHGNFNDTQLNLTDIEFEENDIFIFCLCPDNLENYQSEFPILFLGFIPKKFIQENMSEGNYLVIHLAVKDLLYIGGLEDYLTSFINAINNLFAEVKVYLKKGEYNKVIDLINKDNKKNLPYEKLNLLKGICYYRLGQNANAISSFLKTVEINQQSYLSYHWLGKIYYDLGNYGRALSNYNAEIKICGLNFFAYFNRASVHYKLNNLVQALDDYNVAIKINQNFFQTFYNRGILYYKLGDKYAAIDNYLQAIKINPDLASAHFNLAILYQELSNYKQAIASYQEAIKINPNHINAYYNLAILEANLGLYKRSIETYEKILAIEPNFLPAIYNHKSLVLLLKKEGHIILSENEKSSHIAHAVADIINVSYEEKVDSSLQQNSPNNPSILENNPFDFLAID
ncbi:tetratricopeptide repeat protein [Cyanobacterium aponinum]|uniref:tetratricopeptide repeat protein n=1 Tax=Cyanobacterium aponinum TaxID=379064 RepID=UPI000C12BCEF|nr:tetratricopeptide repeat protein [Cyanobacterium aponinum]PHV61223.1 hypothetical protein CSQ80_16670 [Cyanobacterium aponinum IPPAS B-1201]